jgi:hypothetical protein
MIEYTMKGSHLGGKNVYIVGWTLANGEVGTALPLAQYADRSVQVIGTFGSGGALTFEGSNDGINFHTLTDPQGNNLSFTSAGIEAITEMVAFARPRVLSGDGTTNLTITVAARA